MKRLLLVTLVAACGSEPVSGPERGPDNISPDTGFDSPDLRVDDVSGPRDVRPDALEVDADPVDVSDVGSPSDVEPDAAGDTSIVDSGADTPAPDAAPDTPDTDHESDADADVAIDTEPDVPLCDEDGDGYIAEECGGPDCDDSSGGVHPGRVEGCNFVDDNCDGFINEGLDCRVYAHTSTQLYLVDPFLGTTDFVTTVPSLFDFDTDSEGKLYGISSSRVLHRFNEDSDSWTSVGTFAGASGNGFAIDSAGLGYITAGNNLYSLNLNTAESTLIGAMGGGFRSSGDCVVDKSNQLFMTSSGGSSDTLVAISRETGEGRLVGPTGSSGIWGLTAAWGFLFGFNSSGQVLEIDPGTGSATVRHTFGDLSWYGAASSPGR